VIEAYRAESTNFNRRRRPPCP